MQPVRQGIAKRLVAAVIDAVVLAVPAVVLGVVLSPVPYFAAMAAPALYLAYAGLDVVRGQTVGKMVLNLKITAADGTAATKGMLLERYAIKCAGAMVLLAGAISTLSVVTMFGSLIGLGVGLAALLMLRPDRLAGHDLLAGTAVFGPEAFEFTMPKLTEPAVTVAG